MNRYDQVLVRKKEELLHEGFGESDAAGGIGFVALTVDEDGTSKAIDAVAVVTRSEGIVIVRHVVNQMLSGADTVNLGGVDNLVVVVGILTTIMPVRYLQVGNRGSGIGQDTKGLPYRKFTNGRLAIAFALFAEAISADIGGTGIDQQPRAIGLGVELSSGLAIVEIFDKNNLINRRIR